MASTKPKNKLRTTKSDTNNIANIATQIERVNELSKTARVSWLSLIAYLAFVGITLLGVQDADFFIPTRQTRLPLVAVSIPTYFFFWVAPALGAALYTYMHLHLFKLWDALAKIPPNYRNAPISDSLTPWLLVDLGLGIRNDGSLRKHSMAKLSKWVTIFLVFASGPLVLTYSWFRSFPAHDLWVTVLGNGVPMIISFIMCWASWKSLLLLIKEPEETPKPWQKAPVYSVILCSQLIFFIGSAATQGLGAFATQYLPVRANLIDVNFAERPKNWIEPATHRRRFFVKWCPKNKQPIDECLDYFNNLEYNIEAEWINERENYLSNVDAIDLNFKDFRNAQMQGAFLPNADLSNAKLDGADFYKANLEGAQFSNTNLINTNFIGTQLDRALFINTSLEHVKFNFANLEGAYFYKTRFIGTSFIYAQLNRAKFREVRFDSVNFSGAKLVEAKFDPKSFALPEQQTLEVKTATTLGFMGSTGKTKLSSLGNSTAFQSGYILAHSADFRRVKGLTNLMLKNAIGDEKTLFDNTNSDRLYIWSCWSIDNTPNNLAQLLEQTSPEDIDFNKDNLHAKIVCPRGNNPFQVGNLSSPNH